MAQELNHHQLKQPVHHRLATAMFGKGFVEQPVQRAGDHWDLLQRHHDGVGQRHGQWVIDPPIKAQRSRHHLGALGFCRDQPMGQGTRHQHQAGLGNTQGAVGHFQAGLAFLEQVNPAALLQIAGVEGAVQGPAVKGIGTDAEVHQQCGQAIHDSPDSK